MTGTVYLIGQHKLSACPVRGMNYGMPGWVYLIGQHKLAACPVRGMNYGMPGWVFRKVLRRA